MVTKYILFQASQKSCKYHRQIQTLNLQVKHYYTNSYKSAFQNNELSLVRLLNHNGVTH